MTKDWHLKKKPTPVPVSDSVPKLRQSGRIHKPKTSDHYVEITSKSQTEHNFIFETATANKVNGQPETPSFTSPK